MQGSETTNWLQEYNCKKHKHKKSKQHITKQPMDHWSNQRGNRYLETNEKEINNSNLWDTTKLVLKGKFTVIHANHSKQEISQMYNLTLYSMEQRIRTKFKVSKIF